MANYKFKVFDTIANFRKLYEADENVEQEAPVEGDAQVEQEAAEQAAPVDATDPNNAAPEEGNNPEEQADPEAGEFVSDNQKAMFAKMLLDALMAQPPSPGTIPQQWMNATTDNADEIIKYVQGLNALEAPLSLDNESNPNSMAGALKTM